MKKISIFLTFLYIFIMAATPASVQAKKIEVRSYLITPGEEIKGNPILNNVIFNKTLNIGYRSGRVVISSTPDGTGPITVPDELVVATIYPSAESFRYSPPCSTNLKPPLDISHVLWKSRIIGYANVITNFIYRNCRTFIHENGTTKDYAQIGPLYIVHFDDHDNTAPTPFLELPWNYKGKGLSFADAALAMTSYFDHEYPLLSTILSEPANALQSLVKFDNPVQTNNSYSSHDGYDWGIAAGAGRGEPVLAAAAGTATFINTCGPCGNAIHINHGNGYQTRYYHLLDEGLISSEPGKTVAVNAGQQIGKTGYTGNVIPRGPEGSHIHFMVIHDKNGDGNFNDNIPDGLVDPFGWQSKEIDPWENYTFNYAGQERTGSPSHYLWKTELPLIKGTITANGGTFMIDKTRLVIPKNTFSQDVVLQMHSIQPEADNNNSMLRGVQITIRDSVGNLLTTFQKMFDVVISVTQSDIARYKPETVSIYSRSGGGSWQKEETVLDFTKNEAKTTVNHLSEFAIMGEKIDTIAPETEATITGRLHTGNIYTSSVSISLTSIDKPLEGTLGVEYTLYKLNDENWQEYKDIINIEDAGDYTLVFYSVDGDGNSEQLQNVTFSIDYVPLTPTTVPNATPTPTAVLSPTVTVIPTKTPKPTQTPTTRPTKAVTPTPTKKPKSTVTPTQRPTATPTKTPTPTPKPKQPNAPGTTPLLCKIYRHDIIRSILSKFLNKKDFEEVKRLCTNYKHK